MPERADFLAAIRHAPDEDAPRLIYADWLDDHGDAERAAFIRFQCALGPDNSREFGWIDRTVLRRVGPDAARRFLDRVRVSEVECFERGFLSGIECPARGTPSRHLGVLAEEPIGRLTVPPVAGDRVEEFVHRAGDALRVHTLNCQIDLLGRPIDFGPLLDCRTIEATAIYSASRIYPPPEPGRFRFADRLRTMNLLPDRVALAAGACGRPLRSLHVEIPQYIPNQRWAGQVPGVASLEHLRLDSLGLQGDPLSAVLAPFSGGNLRSLELDAHQSLRPVADWPGAAHLERLALASLTTIDADVKLLVEATPNLRAFKLSGLGVAEPPADAWRGLDELEIDVSTAGDAIRFAAPLARSLSRLTLSVRIAEPDDDLADLLRRAVGLKSLALRGFPAESLKRVAEAAPAGLEVLDATAIETPPAGLKPAHVNALARSRFGANLKALRLGRSGDKRVVSAAIRHFGPRCDAYWYQG